MSLGIGHMASRRARTPKVLLKRLKMSVLGFALAAAVGLGLIASLAGRGWLESIPVDAIPLPLISAGKSASPKLVEAIPASRRSHRRPLSPARARQPALAPARPHRPTASGVLGSGQAVEAPVSDQPVGAHHPGAGEDAPTPAPTPTAAAPVPTASSPAPAPSAPAAPPGPAPTSGPPRDTASTGGPSNPGRGNGRGGNGRGHVPAKAPTETPPVAEHPPTTPPIAKGGDEPGEASEPEPAPVEPGNSAYGHSRGHHGSGG